MLQLVDALDGETARGADFLDFSGRMLSVFTENGSGTSKSLQGE